MSEYKFRQCPKVKEIQCRYDEDRCGECPIAKTAPAPAARKEIRLTNPETAAYIRGQREYLDGYADIDKLRYEKLSRYEDTGLEPEEIKIRWERTR